MTFINVLSLRLYAFLWLLNSLLKANVIYRVGHYFVHNALYVTLFCGQAGGNLTRKIGNVPFVIKLESCTFPICSTDVTEM